MLVIYRVAHAHGGVLAKTRHARTAAGVPRGLSEVSLMTALTAGLFVAMFLLVSHLQGTVHAYLDPGTGSIAIQIILGGMVALIATAKLYWERIRTFFRRKTADHDVAPQSR